MAPRLILVGAATRLTHGAEGWCPEDILPRFFECI